MKEERIRVSSELLQNVISMYESQRPEFQGMFNSTMVVTCALNHVLGKEIDIVVCKGKIKMRCE